MAENDKQASVWHEWVNIWIRLIEEKRKVVADAVASLPADSTRTIQSEEFMSTFSRLQVLIAELFAREEEVIRLIGLPDSEKRRHILAHSRLLDVFNDVYMDSLERKNTMASEVFNKLRVQIEQHINMHDLNLQGYITHQKNFTK